MIGNSGRIRGSFGLKVALAVGLVIGGDWLFWQQGHSGGAIGFFGVAMVLAMLLAHPAITRHRPAAAAAGMATIYALAMVYSSSLLAWLMFWVAAAMAVLLPKSGRFDDGWRWFQRLAGHAVMALAGPLPDWLRRKRSRARRGVARRPILPVVALPLAGTVLFVWLFAVANPVIEGWLASLTGPRLDVSTTLRVTLWAILAWLVWAVLRPRAIQPGFGTFDGSGDLAMPGVSPASVLLSLVAFNALFALQNAMDAAWLWGLMPLPKDITLAEYAHRGAYPLVATALLAALFVLVALRPGSETARMPVVRRLVVAWIGQNLFLVFNAALRTVDYVEAYSLTVLRIAALLWMMLVAIGLALVLWRMLAGKTSAWLINTNLAAAAVLLTGVCWIDLGAVAAQWNVRHAREIDGDGARLDLCYLRDLGDAALLPLIELERRRLAPGLHGQVTTIRRLVQNGVAYRVDHGGWDWLSAHRLAEARRRAGPDVSVPEGFYGIRCDGLPYATEASQPAPALTAAPER